MLGVGVQKCQQGFVQIAVIRPRQPNVEVDSINCST